MVGLAVVATAGGLAIGILRSDDPRPARVPQKARRPSASAPAPELAGRRHAAAAVAGSRMCRSTSPPSSPRRRRRRTPPRDTWMPCSSSARRWPSASPKAPIARAGSRPPSSGRARFVVVNQALRNGPKPSPTADHRRHARPVSTPASASSTGPSNGRGASSRPGSASRRAYPIVDGGQQVARVARIEGPPGARARRDRRRLARPVATGDAPVPRPPSPRRHDRRHGAPRPSTGSPSRT